MKALGPVGMGNGGRGGKGGGKGGGGRALQSSVAYAAQAAGICQVTTADTDCRQNSDSNQPGSVQHTQCNRSGKLEFEGALVFNSCHALVITNAPSKPSWITAVVIITTTIVPTIFVITAALMIVKCLRHRTGCNLLLIGHSGINTV